VISNQRCPILDASQPGEVRRAAAALASAHAFSETAAGHVALVVTEAATNLVKHAGGGEILLRPIVEGEEAVIEILALDKGGGMRNVAECQRDGYSTTGGPGTGLGSIWRLSTFSDLYSQPGRGTVMLARVSHRLNGPAVRPHGALIGGISVAMAGEAVCGDAWDSVTRGSDTMLTVVDGLGHGPSAAEATELAVRAFQTNATRSPREVLEAMHASLRGTRGAAAGVARLDGERQQLTYAGVGNISGSVMAGGSTRRLVSYNGIVGQVFSTHQEFAYPWPPGALLVLHSDGITTHWRLDAYPGLEQRHPSLIAGVLYRDFTRGRDDATVVVAKGVPA